jgi:hypothetical protein
MTKSSASGIPGNCEVVAPVKAELIANGLSREESEWLIAGGSSKLFFPA